MPDLIPHHFWRCSAEIERVFPSSSDPKITYKARSDGFNVDCDCPGFRYRQQCKHASQMFTEACGWNEEWDSRGLKISKSEHTYSCPSCGGPVTSFTDMI